jgi:hypothetical protein
MILDALNLGLAGAVSFLEQQVGVFGYKAVGGGSSPEISHRTLRITNDQIVSPSGGLQCLSSSPEEVERVRCVAVRINAIYFGHCLLTFPVQCFERLGLQLYSAMVVSQCLNQSVLACALLILAIYTRDETMMKRADKSQSVQRA